MILFVIIVAALFLGILGGFLIGKISNTNIRRSAAIVFALTPVVGWLSWGAVDGCFIFGSGSEHCMGFGFGLVLLSPAMLLWAIGALAACAFGRMKTSSQ